MGYTHGHHSTVLRGHAWRTAENSAGHLLGSLRPGMTVLDVGCGPGTITAGLADRVAPGAVVGVDAAPEAVAAARATSPHDGVAYEVADVGALPYPDDAFDVVHAHQVLQHLPDPVGALREMRRVARELVAVREADFGGVFWHPRPSGLDAWQPVYEAVARGNGGEPHAGRMLPAWVRRAGFTDVRATASAWVFTTPEEREWWADTWGGRMVDSAVAEQAVARGHATRDVLAAIDAGFREWAAVDDATFVVPHVELVCRA